MRIARALALAGLGSRRRCERYVTRGSIRVNGELVKDLGRQVNPETDVIMYRQRVLEFQGMVYFVLFKPEGYTTTASDPHTSKTVYELLPDRLVRATRQSHEGRRRVFPVGRLDKDSCGLLLFTNDGHLAHQLTHPRYGVGKWYEVKLNRALDPIDVRRMLQGVKLKEGYVKVEKAQRVSRRTVRLLLQEGKNREIRRILKALGYETVRLVRIAFGPVSLGRLRPGEGRFLSPVEIASLKTCRRPDPRV